MKMQSYYAHWSLLILGAFGVDAAADKVHLILDPEESGAQLDARISSPAEYLGFEIGGRPVRHNEVAAYLRHLSDQSPRADFAEYGASSQGRGLFYLVISSPDNLEGLPDIQQRLDRIGDGEGHDTGLIERTPAVAWLGYGIHGDELSSSDAAVMAAYRLVAGEDEEMQQIRRNLVVYVDPMFNPDGRARAIGHADSFRRTKSSIDSQDIVHNQLWPDGRGNHYFFDLNRDALFQIQGQSRQRIRVILDANPQLYVASHETEWSDTYLFAVPAEPLNPYLPAEVHQAWADFSRDHSAAFDEIGSSYYTRAWNEVFYPGYYDILPAYFGAVPILYEQAATAGLSVRVPAGQILTFRTAVSNHFRSTMANLVTASRSKDTLLNRWANVRREAQRDVSRTKSWIVLPDSPYKSRETLRILSSLDIRVETLIDGVTASGLHSYWDDDPFQMELPAGTLKIDLDQPMSRLIHNVFDFHVPMSVEFLAQEKRNLDLGHDTQIYDVTAWSLPLAFNANIFWTGSRVRGDWRTVEGPAMPRPPGSGDLGANYGYIYVDDSLHATARLVSRGLKIRVGKEPFVHEGVRYPAGTFLVRRHEQTSDALAELNEEFESGDVKPVAAQSARITEGGPDLGGDDFNLLERADIAILGGSGVSVTNFGAIWHLFDETIGIPVTLLNVANLDELDLSKYSVIVFPEVQDVTDAPLSEAGEQALDGWIRTGGTLIAMGKSSLLLARSELSSMHARSAVLDEYPPLMIGRPEHQTMSEDFLGLSSEAGSRSSPLQPIIGDTARHFVMDEFSRFDDTNEISTFVEWSAGLDLPDDDKIRLAAAPMRYLPHGAYLRVDLKPKHRLGYGVGDKIPALFRDEDVLVPGESSQLIARYASPGNLMLSGLVWPEAVGYIAGTAYLIQEQKDRGRIIAFANDPVFRGYSLGTARLFLNAVLLAGAD